MRLARQLAPHPVRGGKSVLLLSALTGGDGLFCGGEVPKVDGAVIKPDFRAPLPSVGVPVHACKPRSVVARHPHVSKIDRAGHVAEIGDGVVLPVAVDVVDISSRPVTVMDSPRDAMGGVCPPVNIADAVAAPHCRKRLLGSEFVVPCAASLCRVATWRVHEALFSWLPNQVAGLWNVIEQFPKKFGRSVGLIRHA